MILEVTCAWEPLITEYKQEKAEVPRFGSRSGYLVGCAALDAGILGTMQSFKRILK